MESRVRDDNFDLLVIDTWQKATGGLSSFDDERLSPIIHRLTGLTRTLGTTVIVNDHFRKTEQNKRRRDLDLNDVKGTGAKIQNSDVFILMDRDANGRLRIKGSSKDADRPIGFLLDIAPEGSTDLEKFTYLGDLEDFARQSKERGAATRQSIIDAMAGISWISSGEIARKIEMTASTVRRQLDKLIQAGIVEEAGDGRWKRYQLINRATASDETRDRET